MGEPLDVGLYEHLLTARLGRRMADVDPDLLTTGPVDAVAGGLDGAVFRAGDTPERWTTPFTAAHGDVAITDGPGMTFPIRRSRSRADAYS